MVGQIASFCDVGLSDSKYNLSKIAVNSTSARVHVSNEFHYFIK